MGDNFDYDNYLNAFLGLPDEDVVQLDGNVGSDIVGRASKVCTFDGNWHKFDGELNGHEGIQEPFSAPFWNQCGPFVSLDKVIDRLIYALILLLNPW